MSRFDQDTSTMRMRMENTLIELRKPEIGPQSKASGILVGALLGAIHESLVGPLAPDNMDDPAKLRDAVQTVTLLALRAVGVMDARARGLVVQAVLPAKALVGA